MPENEPYYRLLLERYLESEVPDADAWQLFDFLKDQPELAARLLEEKGGRDYLDQVRSIKYQFDEATNRRIFERLLLTISTPVEEKPEAPVRHIPLLRRSWTRYAAAAILLLAIAGYWLTTRKTLPTAPVAVQPIKNDVLPGGNHATLTLANGQKIILDTAATGLLATQGGIAISKSSQERISYVPPKTSPGKGRAEGGPQGGEQGVETNTLTTPKGGQYQLTLSDGTRVWLNAASSITYPTAFRGSDRQVTVTGEAYFEVVHNSKMPFRVRVGEETIEDIGTSFNVMAYPEETGIRTTLLQGAIKLSIPGTNGPVLHPGQQALAKAQNVTVTNDVDIDQVMAWKNGLFSFDKADVKTVMRQLARWYDIDVKYEGPVPERHFKGELPRDLTLSQVMKGLKDMQLKFRIEGKTLILLK